MFVAVGPWVLVGELRGVEPLIFRWGWGRRPLDGVKGFMVAPAVVSSLCLYVFMVIHIF